MRVNIVLACTECKERNYFTQKNKKNDPDRLEFNKYCRRCGKHREVRSEMRKVTWPTKSDLTTYTIVVFVSVAIVSGFIWIADSILYKLISLILR